MYGALYIIIIALDFNLCVSQGSPEKLPKRTKRISEKVCVCVCVETETIRNLLP